MNYTLQRTPATLLVSQNGYLLIFYSPSPGSCIFILDDPVRVFSPSDREAIHANKIPPAADPLSFRVCLDRLAVKITGNSFIIGLHRKNIFEFFRALRHGERLRWFEPFFLPFSQIEPISQKIQLSRSVRQLLYILALIGTPLDSARLRLRQELPEQLQLLRIRADIRRKRLPLSGPSRNPAPRCPLLFSAV